MPLDAAQIEQSAQRLKAREAELQSEVRSLADEDDAPGKLSRTDVDDDGAVAEQRIRDAVRYAEKERDIEELREIASANDRIAEGSYGECIDCASDIPYARLEVRPSAPRCIGCQEAYERTHDVGPHISPSLSIPIDPR